MAQKTGQKVPTISQSSVATRLRFDGIFRDEFTTNLLLSLMVKESENRSAFGETTSNRVAPFWDTWY